MRYIGAFCQVYTLIGQSDGPYIRRTLYINNHNGERDVLDLNVEN